MQQQEIENTKNHLPHLGTQHRYLLHLQHTVLAISLLALNMTKIHLLDFLQQILTVIIGFSQLSNSSNWGLLSSITLATKGLSSLNNSLYIHNPLILFANFVQFLSYLTCKFCINPVMSLSVKYTVALEACWLVPH